MKYCKSTFKVLVCVCVCVRVRADQAPYGNKFLELCVISQTRREVVENCTILDYYAASNGNFLQTFRDNLSVQSSVFKNPKERILDYLTLRTGMVGCPETSV
jgi:hypothetical protein